MRVSPLMNAREATDYYFGEAAVQDGATPHQYLERVRRAVHPLRHQLQAAPRVLDPHDIGDLGEVRDETAGELQRAHA